MLYPNGYQPAEHRRALDAMLLAMAAPPRPAGDDAHKPHHNPPLSRVLQERRVGGACSVMVRIAPTATAPGELRLA